MTTLALLTILIAPFALALLIAYSHSAAHSRMVGFYAPSPPSHKRRKGRYPPSKPLVIGRDVLLPKTCYKIT
jgi:hypothetical protein